MQVFLDSIFGKQNSTYSSTQTTSLTGYGSRQMTEHSHQTENVAAILQLGTGDSDLSPSSSSGAEDDESPRNQHVVQNTIHHSVGYPPLPHPYPSTSHPIPFASPSQPSYPTSHPIPLQMPPIPPFSNLSSYSSLYGSPRNHMRANSPSSSPFSYSSSPLSSSPFQTLPPSSPKSLSNSPRPSAVLHSIPLPTSAPLLPEMSEKQNGGNERKRKKKEKESESPNLSSSAEMEDAEESTARDMVHKLSEKNRRDRLR